MTAIEGGCGLRLLRRPAAKCQLAAEREGTGHRGGERIGESKVDIDFPIRPLKSSVVPLLFLLLLFSPLLPYIGAARRAGEGHGAEWVAAVALGAIIGAGLDGHSKSESALRGELLVPVGVCDDDNGSPSHPA